MNELMYGRKTKRRESVRKEWDAVDFITSYENGELPDDKVVAGFQRLIDSGVVWQLQGSYGKQAAVLIEAGMVNDPREKRRKAK